MSLDSHAVESITRPGPRPRRAARRLAPIAAAAAWLASVSTVAGEAPRGDVLWAKVLREHVRSGAVDYDSLALDRPLLQAYISWLAVVLPEGTPKPDRIAFYINAYNACTVDLIVREQVARRARVRTIRSIPGAWTGYRWEVEGRNVTLDQMERDTLRGKFAEPRIHFALVCASRSCPALRSVPYEGALLDAQLDSAAREFVLDPARNEFSPREGRIRISKIFDWFGKDFAAAYHDSTLERLYGRVNGAVLACACRYLPPETAAALRAKPIRVEYLPYDWSLNGFRGD